MNQRKSNFELLRIVAMFLIVLYHLISYFIVPIDDTPIYKAIQIPLHIGVILFVLISGYFKIRPSLKGLVSFMLPIIVYYIGGNLIFHLYKGNISEIDINQFLFLSQSPYWFIRTYLYLYLLSPILNIYIQEENKRLYLLSTLGFIALYMGMTKGDPSLSDGKNIVNFCFLYVLGNTINYFRFNSKIRKRTLLFSWGLINIILVTTFIYSPTYISKIIWNFSFPYNSPLLIVNSILIFLFFFKLNLQNNKINTLSTSVFSIYLIHQHPCILYGVIQPIVKHIYSTANPKIELWIALVVITLIIMGASILLDKIYKRFQDIIIKKIS